MDDEGFRYWGTGGFGILRHVGSQVMLCSRASARNGARSKPPETVEY